MSAAQQDAGCPPPSPSPSPAPAPAPSPSPREAADREAGHDLSHPRVRRRLRPLEGLPDSLLLVHEIFASVQGESSYVGRPCTFVRTTACNLRCTYCDTRHAFARGERMSQDEVFARVVALGLPLVLVTGGEPLLQPAVLPLMARLLDHGLTVMCETSGSLSIAEVDERVVKVVDLKTPSSGEAAANLWSNVPRLAPHDELKFVVGGREDYLWAREQILHRGLAERCQVLMGPVFGAVEPAALAEWILADRLPVRLQIQLHKVLWDPERTGV